VSTISKHYTFLIKIASIFASVHHIKTLHFPYHIFKCQPYQNTTLSLSKLRPYLLVSTISKHYTFLITYSSVHHFKNTTHSLSKLRPYLLVSTLYQTLHFPYQNCVHIFDHIFKCPLYQNTTLFLSKLRPYFLSHIQVSTISKHYTFLIKIASIFLITYSSVHYIKTLHFSYQNCVHISYRIFKCPLYQNTTISLSKLRPYFLSHIQVSTISKHYTFLIKIAPIFLITYASVHYIKTLHFPYQNCAHISYHICKCPPYHNTTLFLYKHAKIASIDKCPLYQMASFFLHYCPPYHSQHFFCAQSPQLGLSHVLNNFPNESLPKIAKIEFFSSFLMKVCPKSQNLGFPYLLSRFYNKVYPKSQNLRLGRVPIWSVCVPT
jgi:hypothetical protein